MPTIMVVDDNEDIRDALTELLCWAGYRVLSAENGARACEMLAGSERPRLLLLDLSMPEMDGLQLMRVLAETGMLSSLSIVVLSACARGVRLPHARVVLQKPTTPELLLAVISELCSEPMPQLRVH